MLPKLSPKNETVTLVAKTPEDAYAIAWIYFELFCGSEDTAPWDLDMWRRTLRGQTELYFIFKTEKQRGRFLREIAKSNYEYMIFVNRRSPDWKPEEIPLLRGALREMKAREKHTY